MPNIYTAFCVATDESDSTTWIQEVIADNMEKAKAEAVIVCATAWGYNPAYIHCLGIAQGSVNILVWDDLK